MITASDLIALFNRMYTEHWAYKWGSAQTGCVDCAGAFVWAYRQYGQSIYHGSNRIARRYVVELLPVSQARPGMAAFKVRKPGEEYYDLKAEYRQGGKYYNGDLNDYYHIGLVDDNTQYVLNAQSAKTGFVRSKITENWVCVAWLKDVQHDEGSKETVQRQVSGGKLNMRKKADSSSTRIMQIPDGAVVTIDEYGEKWCRVIYENKEGYVLTKFLTPVEDNTAPTANDETSQYLCKAQEALEEAKKYLCMLQEKLTGAVG